MRHALVRFSVLLVLLFSTHARAVIVEQGGGLITGTLIPPSLVEGQFVYTIPADFDPPMIGKAGLQHIQGVAKGLHFPFYVVLVERIPRMDSNQMSDSRSKGYRETGDELQATYAIDRLAEDWAKQYPNTYDVSKSSIFLLSYEKRDYRVLAGSDWKTKLGLEKNNLKSFEQEFLNKVTGTPKDPKGGIIALISKFDEHVFDQTDPVRVAARAEADRKRAEAKRLVLARGELDKRIGTLSGLLENPEYLPSDASSYQDLLIKAKATRGRDVPDEMLLLAESMSGSLKVLDEAVSKKQSEARAEMVKETLQGVLIFSLLGILLIFVLIRFRKYKSWKYRFRRSYDLWMDNIKNAAGQYVRSYGERTDIVAMDDTTGKTRELWNKVTQELDDLWTVVKAIEGHLETCSKVFSKGSLFNFGPFKKGWELLNGEFDFDTGEINRTELFGKETKHISLSLNDVGEFTNRFKEVQEGWDRLREAASIRLQDARTQFPHTTMSEIEEKAATSEIPKEWYADHPLAGDDNSDTKVWDEADALRWEDPVGYLDRLNALREKELDVARRIGFLLNWVDEVKGSHEKSVPALPSKVNADDDPNITLAALRQAENEFFGLLKAKASSQDTTTLEVKVDQINELRQKCSMQVAVIEAAISSAEKDVKVLASRDTDAMAELTLAVETSKALTPVHSNLADGIRMIEAADSLMKQARQATADAKAYLNEGNHLSASRKAEKTKGLYDEVVRLAHAARAFFDQLEEARRTFEKRASQMRECYDSTVRKVRGYNSSALVRSYSPVSLGGGPNDFTAALSILDGQVREWDRAISQAKREYEAEQARIREEQRRREAARRAAEEAEAARRRRESYSSYSSSSSSSWDGGGSSSSGSSWGGGGSSSSGGKW